MTKEDFITWKQDEVTKRVFETMKNRITELSMVVIKSAGVEPLNDRFMSGMVAAYEELLNISVEDLETEDA